MPNDPNTPVPASQVPKKPITGRILGGVAAGVLGLCVVISTVISLFSSAPPKAQPGEVQQPAAQPAVKQFAGDVERAREIIQQNTANASKVASVAAAYQAQLPDCNQGLRDRLKGNYYVLPSHDPNLPDANLVCEPNNEWVALPPALGQMQQETPAQMAAEAKGTATGGMSRAEKLKARRQAALQSNPIPVHFADSQAASTKKATATEGADAGPTYEPAAGIQPASEVLSENPVRSPVGEKPNATAVAASAAAPEPAKKEQLGIQLSHYRGPQYPIFQGRILEGLLANRLIGEQGGPVKVQITTPVYSQDSQHLLIPPGSVLLGEAARVESSGEHRLVVVFHRVIMPDGWSFVLEPTHGLDQQGAGGSTGKLDRHLASLIGTAVLVGAIEGLSNFTSVGSLGGDEGGVIQIQSGMSRESSNEAMQILRRTLNRPTGITVYEGTRVRVWVARDQALPSYENHVVIPAVE